MSRTLRELTHWDFMYNSKNWKSTRDKKRWYKPNKEFKKCYARCRKAKERMVMKNDIFKNDLDDITFHNHRREDQWLWN